MKPPSPRIAWFECVVVALLLTMLGAIAIPAYSRNVRRARTAEIYDSLDRIARGAATYHQSVHTDIFGHLLFRQFPASVGATPSTHCCGSPGGVCRRALENWSNNVWNSLHFVLESDHYYQYQFDSFGSDGGSRFTAWAKGDLDCDGVTATWRRMGSVVPVLTPEIGPILVDPPMVLE